jgi:hypothetical protein
MVSRPRERRWLASLTPLRSPWHGACFNGKTGDIEDAPAPQNLQKYKLEVEGTDIYVTADPEQIKENGRKTKAPKEAVQGDKNGVVIVGGGSGALFAVEGLREVRHRN